MFFQVEGLLLDRGITLAHLRGNNYRIFASTNLPKRARAFVLLLPVHRAER